MSSEWHFRYRNISVLPHPPTPSVKVEKIQESVPRKRCYTVTSFQVDKPELVLGYPHLFDWLNHLLCYKQTVRIVWRRPLRESSSSLDQPPPGSQCISLPQVLLVYVAQTAAFHSMLVLSEYAGHLHNGRESLAKLFRMHPYKIQSNNLIFKSKASQGLVIIICLENGGRMVLDVSQ